MTDHDRETTVENDSDRITAHGHRFHDLALGRMAQIADDLDARMALTYLASATAAAMVGAITTTGLFMSLHTASPGTTGANEIVPGTGYTGNRPAVTWGSVTSGVVSSNDTQTFALLLAQTGGIPYYGLWTASTGGTYLSGGPTSGLSGSIPSGANVIFTNGITLTVAG